jgi:hypothetical protein
MKQALSRLSFAVGCFSATALAGDAALPVVRAGNEVADAAAVRRAFGRVPAFQLAALGGDDTARRRAVIEKLLGPELQAVAEARARGLDQSPRTSDRLRELYARASEAELARSSAASEPVTDADVQKYFDEHRDRFELPRRIRIWRIVVKDVALAKKIITESQGASGPARWRAFARDESLDAATKFRDGDLGFVRPDGSTDVPTVRVDPALFAAVDKLKDGEIAPDPLELAAGVAVVWRRGTLPAVSRTAEQEAPAIRTLLARQRVEAARKALVARLRSQYLKAEDAQLLETLPDSMFAPAEPPERRLPPIPSGSPAPSGAETPQPGESGTR